MTRSNAADRRTFLKELGVLVLTVQGLPWTTHASTDPSGPGAEAGDDLIIRSGPGLFGHVHDLVIPGALLEVPPREGVAITSTQWMFHRHVVALTREELGAVHAGRTVVKQASSHVFAIASVRLGPGTRLAPA